MHARTRPLGRGAAGVGIFDDAWCDYGFTSGSPGQFAHFCITALRSHAANQHMIGNVLIDVEGDEAFGEVYFNAYHKVEVRAGLKTLLSRGATWTVMNGAMASGSLPIAASASTGVAPSPPATPILIWPLTASRGGRQDDLVYDRANRRRKQAEP
ncbi:MAG: nuclear transport factor 2 family protein [Haliea sp.]|nr:nuclear transport factor 2 family protein [Haliea sp.]